MKIETCTKSALCLQGSEFPARFCLEEKASGGGSFPFRKHCDTSIRKGLGFGIGVRFRIRIRVRVRVGVLGLRC